MTDHLSKHHVWRDYYREAKQATSAPMKCPYCKRQGRFAANTYEIAKRIPSVMSEGMALCHFCETPIGRQADVVLQLRSWYCGYCELCVCPACQKKQRQRR
ncbi:hypothetical protein conserved [Leishmania donovani]|uniref:Uncharacterized protein n=3 Tax=Leishmania donovani species complex TaxID=38574 RepID=A4I1X7_LEIIN|nr:conserved hypothetical protein [Leishmania infantum JPCM5]XP_003861629.1 hypothetical protein, conserved [Leishmania donovani]CAC9495944.1 hypothetical_protein_-_conserved [Leishmania infantum]AYU79640.1 hypothetical protein LdCL_260009500 [Leishmania donovani]TPP41091.1 hypothetical protein CGC21_31610 [Leishmania donovani]TPP51938.1 hypothetical protein CGC20_4775 [Leishmania donovani]CAJ1989628.1 hypothetical protein conserved [Leishmania donovani]|eukprot:XP_001470388.1 conserved hypothetical protein [Leishmania infantum JPCM5]